MLGFAVGLLLASVFRVGLGRDGAGGDFGVGGDFCAGLSLDAMGQGTLGCTMATSHRIVSPTTKIEAPVKIR